MSTYILIQEIISDIKSSKRAVADTLGNFVLNEKLFSKFLIDIDKCIHMFNQNEYNKNTYINSKHTFDIIGAKLPSSHVIFELITTNREVRDKVKNELIQSEYFKEVWEISNPQYLLINIMILTYRTALLITNEDLLKKEAQISSTIEEMSLELKRKGIDNIIYPATKHWLIKWREEGFSKEVYDLTKDIDRNSPVF